MRALAILAAIAMVVSLFLPWLNPETSAGRLVPWDMVKGLDLSVDGLKTFATSSAPVFLAFLATFALAALFGTGAQAVDLRTQAHVTRATARHHCLMARQAIFEVAYAAAQCFEV